MEIELPIFWNSDKTTELEAMCVDFKIADCKTRKITFYRVDIIAPNFEWDIEISSIWSGG